MAKSSSAWWEVWLGQVVRAGTKNIVRFVMGRMKSKSPKLYRRMAWMHLSKEDGAQKALFAFRAAIVATGTGADVWLGTTNVWPILKEAVESFFQDVTGSWTDYFELNRKEIDITGLPAFTEAEAQELVKELKAFLATDLMVDAPNILNQIPSGIGVSHADRLMRTLFALGDDQLIAEFLEFLDSLEPGDQEIFLKNTLSYYDEPTELIPFLGLDDTTQRKIFGITKRLANYRLIPQLTRMAQRGKAEFDKYFDQVMAATANELGAAADSIEATNALRSVEVERSRIERRVHREVRDELARRSPWYERIPFWIRMIVLAALAFALLMLLTLKGCEMASNSRKVKDAERNALRAQQDSLLQVRRDLEEVKDRYTYLADSLSRLPSGSVSDSASTRRQ